MSTFKRWFRSHRMALTLTALASLTHTLYSPAATALAQQAAAADNDTPIKEVVVTGSRIPQPNLESASPIQVVTAQDFKNTGKQDVIDLLNQLPQNFQNIATDFSNTSNSLSTPGGFTTANLRGLGPQRTLVLVDGRRLGTADANTGNPNPAPDLDQIPVALISRVDVVTGGASATYGSDAIAGVVNFIMRRNFQGFEIDGQLGVFQHNNDNGYIQGLANEGGFTVNQGNVRDGRSKDISIVAGTNIADGNGNVTAYFTYRNADPVTGTGRDYAGCQLSTTLPDTGYCTGSQSSNYFRPTLTGDELTVVGDQFLPFPQASSSPPPFFNSNQYVFMARQDQRYTAGFMAHVDVNDHFKPYADFSFMNDRTTAIVAPSGLFINADPIGADTNYDINCSNPLLTPQQALALCTPADIDADRAAPGSVQANVAIGRRNIEGGGRESYFEHTNYRGVAGFQGTLGNAWNYDAYGQYYYTSLFNDNRNYLNFQGIAQALQVQAGVNGPECISGGACVPYNIFKQGGVTPDQLAFLYTPGTAYGSVTQRIIHADITGQLETYGIKLPWADDGVAVNVGYEHRSEFISFNPDAAELSGNLAGFAGASVAINNGLSVSEGFGEVRVPIAQDRPFIHDLMFDAGYRRSKYDTAAGSTNTYKFEVQYAPIPDIRARGSFQHAIRAPNIIELFTPQAYGQQSFFGVDPCAVQPGGGDATATLIECQRTGITAAQYGDGTAATNRIPQCISNQCGQVIGGNPDLKSEIADTYSVGFTLTPRFLPNFAGSIDYYNIKLEDSVGALPGAFLFQQCLTTGDPLYCSQVVRTPQGALTGASVAGGGYILQTAVNIGAAKVSGIDIQGGYKLDLTDRLGSMTFAVNGAWLQHVESTPRPGAHTYDCVGLFGTTCQTVNPRWRHTFRASWEAPWRTTLSLYWRYIGSVSLDNNSGDPSLNNAEFGEFNAFNAKLPSMSYLDLSVQYKFADSLSIRAGINNVLDKDPPLVATELSGTASPNSYPTYDTLGRQAFVGFTATF
ncbi:MAG: TonB-dependent receptor [Gammaproteobacteria bacterium]